MAAGEVRCFLFRAGSRGFIMSTLLCFLCPREEAVPWASRNVGILREPEQ